MDERMDRERVRADSQHHRAVAAEAAAAATGRELDDERRQRAEAVAVAHDAAARVGRAERAADRADSKATALESELSSARADLDEFEKDYDSLLELEQRVERERAALEKRVEKLSSSDPTQLNKLNRQRAALNSELRLASVEMRDATRQLAERDKEIKSLREQLAKKGEIWLPGLNGLGRGGAHDETTRLLWAKLLTLRVPPAEIAETVASVAYAVAAAFPDELKKMKLPGDNFARTMRPELGVLHQMISALTVGKSDVLCWANDASPLDGRELGATVARVKSVVNGNEVLRDTHLGCYETSDSTSFGEALAIKEKAFDR